MTQTLDFYCERTDPSFWAEPLNAVTNLAFIIAAGLLFTRYKPKTWPPLLLIAFIFIIGTGSFLFHTFATHWAMLTDTIPILMYQIVFLAFYTRHIIGLDKIKTAGLLGLFFIMTIAVSMIPYNLNGSAGYIPPFIFITSLGLYHLKNRKTNRFDLLAAAGIFLVSLTFRTLDSALCNTIPFGLHFIWHLLNAVVLYLTARAYIVNTPSSLTRANHV